MGTTATASNPAYTSHPMFNPFGPLLEYGLIAPDMSIQCLGVHFSGPEDDADPELHLAGFDCVLLSDYTDNEQGDPDARVDDVPPAWTAERLARHENVCSSCFRAAYTDLLEELDPPVRLSYGDQIVLDAIDARHPTGADKDVEAAIAVTSINTVAAHLENLTVTRQVAEDILDVCHERVAAARTTRQWERAILREWGYHLSLPSSRALPDQLAEHGVTSPLAGWTAAALVGLTESGSDDEVVDALRGLLQPTAWVTTPSNLGRFVAVSAVPDRTHPHLMRIPLAALFAGLDTDLDGTLLMHPDGTVPADLVAQGLRLHQQGTRGSVPEIVDALLAAQLCEPAHA